jgi:regulator of RNase E activity RraA
VQGPRHDPLHGQATPKALEEGNVASRRLTGRIAAERIRLPEVPRPPAGVIESLRELEGATELVSDVLDEMGIAAVVAASVLRPTIVGARIVGPALTLHNVRLAETSHTLIEHRHVNRQADYEAHNLTLPGDVLVIQGHPDVSNIGGMSAMLGKREGGLGAIVWGGTRDVAHSRSIGYPIWSTAVTPVTGKWRLETIEINGQIEIAGVPVACGDIVVADDSGVCFIPRGRASEVVGRACRKAEVERRRVAKIQEGFPIAAFPTPNLDSSDE